MEPKAKQICVKVLRVIIPSKSINVEPLGTVRIPGVMLHHISENNDQTKKMMDSSSPIGCLESDLFCVNLEAKYGTLKAVDLITVKQQYNYGNKSSLTLKADNLSDLNQVLLSLLYSNTLYEPKGAIDIVTVVYRSSRVLIPLHVIYKPQPILFDPGQNTIADLVTICIKTFERYPCLHRLIKVRLFRFCLTSKFACVYKGDFLFLKKYSENLTVKSKVRNRGHF